MPKINQEEYEVLKGLEDQREWIARDSYGDHGGNLFAYSEKPLKDDDVRVGFLGSGIHSIDNRFFQFIRWEDEEPYNIAELIREYEYSTEHVSHVVNERVKALGKAWSESEETGVKSKQELIEKWESAIEAAEFYGKGKEDRVISYMRDFVDDLNQLDEPGVLSQEWIDDNTWNNHYVGKPFVYVEDLKNPLVPKQEGLETKIQELIEFYKQEEDAYSNPENAWIGGFIEDLKNLVEKEQKYYVVKREVLDGVHYYFTKFDDEMNGLFTLPNDKKGAYRFEDKEKAQAIANYTDSEVEELEE